MAPHELLQRFTSRELTEQMAYDMVEAEEQSSAAARAASVVGPGDRIPSPAEVTRTMLAWRASRRQGRG
jgi:hypothetical protein